LTTGKDDVADWWSTSIIDMAPGKIHLRGHPVQDLIGSLTFAQMLWLMTRGQVPSDEQAALLESALVAAVDHGPQAPSIATARMAVTCGLGINGALASAVNMLDDVHGGAGEQSIELYQQIDNVISKGATLEGAVSQVLQEWMTQRSPFIPGFGHRYHTTEDPRAPKLLSLVGTAVDAGVVSGRYAMIARSIESHLANIKKRVIPMNIDGATAVVYAELGFAGPLARGLFCLSRSVGIIAHAWEQMEQGGRNKGPTPPVYRWTYKGDNAIDQDQ